MRLGKVQVGLVLLACAWLLAGTARPASAQNGTMQQVGLVRTGTGTFSIDVEGADIRTIVRAISEFSGRNIVVGKDVRGVVKVALKNVGWQEALRTILRSNGLDYIEEGSILRVDDLSKLQTETVERETARAKAMELRPLDTRIIKLNYANAGELATSLQPSLSRRGSVQVEKRTNSLIVSDLEENCAKIEQMASNLDSTTPQIEITAKLVDVDAEALRASGAAILLGSPAERALALELLRFAEALDLTLADHRPNQLTAYLFDLANRYSTFFEQCHVLRAESEPLRQSRLLLCDLTARTIRQGLELLGIQVVEKM